MILSSARQGLPEACLKVGACYFNGDGTGQDFDTASAWIRFAAMSRYQPATAFMSFIHMIEAYAWSKKGQEAGYLDAKIAFEAQSGIMHKDLIERAEQYYKYIVSSHRKVNLP